VLNVTSDNGLLRARLWTLTPRSFDDPTMGFNKRKMGDRRRESTEDRTRKTEKLCLQSHPAWGRHSSKAGYGMESAMKTINWDLRNLIVQTHSGLCWRDIKRQLTGWRQLEGLDDRCLQDIGISRSTANLEAAKPFWNAR
jgi:uncharacterized protein YjiS (DUF1127 family)